MGSSPPVAEAAGTAAVELSSPSENHLLRRERSAAPGPVHEVGRCSLGWVRPLGGALR